MLTGTIVLQPPSLHELRAYPAKFAKQLHHLHQQYRGKPRKALRQKVVLDPMLSDREHFANMALGDAWVDAGLPSVYLYLLKSKSLCIPDSWYEDMMVLKKQLSELASWLHV